jgi:hypothetical protein
MPSKAKKNKNKKTAKPQNKKVAVKTKKVGKTVTFQAKQKADPFGKKENVETGVRSIAPVPQVPNRPHPMMACGCGGQNCRNNQQQPQQIPDIIRQFAEQLGNGMGAQGVVVVSLPLNPDNPRAEPPNEAEVMALLRGFLGR